MSLQTTILHSTHWDAFLTHAPVGSESYIYADLNKVLLSTLLVCCQTVRLASVLADYYTILYKLQCISICTTGSESYNYTDLNKHIATHTHIDLSNWQIRVCVWRLLCHRLLVERESCTVDANTCTFRMGSSREITSPRACAHGVFALSSTEKKFASRCEQLGDGLDERAIRDLFPRAGDPHRNRVVQVVVGQTWRGFCPCDMQRGCRRKIVIDNSYIIILYAPPCGCWRHLQSTII